MNKVSRKEFLGIVYRLLGAAGLLAFIGPVIAYLFPAELTETPTEPLLVGSEQDFPPGASRTVRFGRYPALVIGFPDGIKAYSAVCTHFSCICKWDADKQVIICPCHDGLFDPVDGGVISGPPPEPLASIPITIENGQVYIGGQG